MARMMLDLDEELLAEATSVLSTSTNGDTVNAALRQVVYETRARRQRALVDLQSVADSGGFDFERLVRLDQ